MQLGLKAQILQIISDGQAVSLYEHLSQGASEAAGSYCQNLLAGPEPPFVL